MDSETISNLISLIFLLEKKLTQSIESERISNEVVEAFDALSKKLFDLANQFYKNFETDFVNQFVTFGALSTVGNVCINIKDNLNSAKDRGENPIAADRILDNNYLLYLHSILNEFKTVQKNKTISNNSFLTINESVKTLVSLAKYDNIYKEPEIKFSTKAGEKTLIKTLNNTKFLFD